MTKFTRRTINKLGNFEIWALIPRIEPFHPIVKAITEMLYLLGIVMRNIRLALMTESLKAIKLVKKLFSLRIVQIFIVLLLLIQLVPLILFYFMRPVPQTKINYGVTFSEKYTQQLGLDWQQSYLKILDDLAVKNIRLIVYWDDVEKFPGSYDFSDIRWQLNEAEKRNLNVILAVGRKVPRYPECFEPDWVKETKVEESRENYLYQYLRQTILTLKSYKSIKMWQVENEPFFPFGECKIAKRGTVENEVKIVRSIDTRPVLIQDSGEGGFWFPSYKLGDYLGISMYRKIWFDFGNFSIKKAIYIKYPLAHWAYKIKADLVGVPVNKIIVTELQAEPWGPTFNAYLSKEEKDRTMSRSDFLETISYSQKSGFKDLYFWGVEWWLWEKERENNPFYWDTAKAILRQ